MGGSNSTDLQSRLDEIQGPCPKSHPLFLAWDNRNQYFCYKQNQLNAEPKLNTTGCSLFKEGDKIQKKYTTYLKKGASYGLDAPPCPKK